MERKALGRGISALIPEKESQQQESQKQDKILYVPIEQIKPNPLQPREHFDSQSMEDLVQSIKEKGIIQPILVRQKSDYYELIAGERRWRAANLLNLTEMPVIVKEAEDLDSLELSLIENIQRQDLNPIEEARAYQYLIDKFELTQEKLSEILGKARVSVTNTLRLLKLPQEIQEEIKKGNISFAHGRALLEIEDSRQQRRLAQEIISNSLSVKELDNLIKIQAPRLNKRKLNPASQSEPYLAVLEEELQHNLATKVRVIKKKKHGYILIEFYSQEDLDRIVNRIKGANETH